MQAIKNFTVGLCALAMATAIWIPCLHFFFIKELTAFRPHRRAFTQSAAIGRAAPPVVDRSGIAPAGTWPDARQQRGMGFHAAAPSWFGRWRK